MTAIPTHAELQARIARARAAVRERPALDDVEPVGPGERSVWRFPRPPRIAPIVGVVEVRLGETLVARSERAFEVLETSSPPVPYFPPDDIVCGELCDTPDWALCEWKGVGVYFDLRLPGRTVAKAGWRIPDPLDDLGRGYTLLKSWVAFLPAAFTCRRDGRPVQPQTGGYYGGWITPELRGPFKGEAGSEHW